MNSWRKDHGKGDRKRRCPEARGFFFRVKQTLCKLEGDRLRLTIFAHRYVYFDLSKRCFKLPDNISSKGIGEPAITPGRIYQPIRTEEDRPEPIAERMAWDFNTLSLEGFSPQTGWAKIYTRSLATAHISSFEECRPAQRGASKSKKAGRTLSKRSRKERNRARGHRIGMARVISSLAKKNGLEGLKKERMYTNLRIWNRRLDRTGWRDMVRKVEEQRGEEATAKLPPQLTSRTRPRSWWVSKDLMGSPFRCGNCGLKMDRQLDAVINLYLRMEGTPHKREWWDGDFHPLWAGTPCQGLGRRPL